MRKDAGVDGDAQRIGQLAWMIFLKILDDQEQKKKSIHSSYLMSLPNNLRWHYWTSKTSGLIGDDLLDFINNDLFMGLRDLSKTQSYHPLNQIISSVFENSYNYMRSGYLIRQVTDKINENIYFNDSNDYHLFGDIYEKILRNLQNAGNAGEYYTPRAVTEFVTEMVDPRLGEVVLDPACGTGGFLTCCIDHIRSKYVRNSLDEGILQRSIRGIEKKPLPHLLCVTNMFLHGIEVPAGIRRGNALDKLLHLYTEEDQVEVIITNPPFGGQEEDNVDANFPTNLRTKETADLFFLLIMRLLKAGGRAAVVLPDSFLFGQGVKTRIKEKLLKECNLHTIIRLPKGVFNPYTDIKTNILFFTKGIPTKEIWYYDHPYPSGYKSYSKTKPIRVQEFEQEKQWWNNREENSFAWKVSIEEIKANGYNLDMRNPNNAVTYNVDFDSLLFQYKQLVDQTNSLRSEIRSKLISFIGDRKSLEIQRFFNNFDLLTATSKGIEKLRNLILQLAMQGALVPVDFPIEESAEDLYERICNIREGLVKDGILKQSLSVSPIELDKVPFRIPDTWKWVRLGDIAQVVGGGTPDTNQPEFFSDNGIPWLTPADLYQLKDKFVRRGKRDLSTSGLQKSSARMLPQGSVLFSSRAPIGYVAIAANDLATNQGFKSCIPYIMEMNEFIYYFLLFAHKDIEKTAPGTTFKEVSGKIMRQILIPLPSLDEQQLIARKVNELMMHLQELLIRVELLQDNYETLLSTLEYDVLHKESVQTLTYLHGSLEMAIS